jgi:hypothetical protein
MKEEQESNFGSSHKPEASPKTTRNNIMTTRKNNLIPKFVICALVITRVSATIFARNSCDNNPDPFSISDTKTDTCANLAIQKWKKRDKRCANKPVYLENCPGICDDANCGCIDIALPIHKKGKDCEWLQSKNDNKIESKCRKNLYKHGCPGTCSNQCRHTGRILGNWDFEDGTGSIVGNWDFEDGTILPWKPNGGTTVEQSEEHAYSGNYGGLVTERESTWQGFYQDITNIVQPGVIYEFSTLAKLVGVDDDYSERFVFKVNENYRLTVDGVTTEHTDYASVAGESDLTNEWTKVFGSYQFNIDDGREYISQELYAVTTESTSDFAIDEVVMVDALPVNADVFVDASQNTERVVIPQPPAVDLTAPRTGCPHLETPNLVSWESLYPSLSAGSNLRLPDDTSVLISNTVETELGILTIPDSSKIIFGENENGIALDVRGINVTGSLIAGSETCRYETPLTITLHGSRPPETKKPHYKGISVTGRIDLHGKRYYRTWTK